MTAKENVLAIYPEAKAFNGVRVCSDPTLRNEPYYAIEILVRPPFGFPYEKTIATCTDQDYVWELAWQHIQQEMVEILEESTDDIDLKEQIMDMLKDEISREIDKEILRTMEIHLEDLEMSKTE